MENKMCKQQLKNSCTLTQAYKSYDDYYKVGYKTYRNICEDFNKKIMDDILLKSKEFKMPFRLGSLRIKKKKMNFSNKLRNKLKIDWKATRENNKVIYHLNDHTNGYNYRWYWEKRNAIIKNKSIYSFQATRTNKRRLATLLQNNEIDYFE